MERARKEIKAKESNLRLGHKMKRYRNIPPISPRLIQLCKGFKGAYTGGGEGGGGL